MTSNIKSGIVIRFILIVLLFFLINPNLSSQDILLDYDGNKYKTITIGAQCWMADNLRSSHDANGQKINRVCYFNNADTCIKYGGLYSWHDLKLEESDQQGICPHGWHIPSDYEWQKLVDEVGGADSAAMMLNYGPYHGFNVRFGGNYHTRLLNFNYLDKIEYYWSSTAFSRTAAFMLMVGRNNRNTNRSTVPKIYALSVRCLKNK